MNEIDACCAECGVAGGVSLKTCKSCMCVRYCNPTCQRNHWPKHKKECKQRAAELHDEALFKDPPPKEDCPICFLPMPVILVCCASLPPATISSLPIYDFAKANAGLEGVATDQFFTCCGKRFCAGCICSFNESGNIGRCPFCNSNLDTERCSKTNEEIVEEIMKRVEANDAGAIYLLSNHYCYGNVGLQQDLQKGKELLNRAAELGSSHAHYYLANDYFKQGGRFLKKAKFHYEAAAMAGNEGARHFLGTMEAQNGNMERALKHWKIAASAGEYHSMYELITAFKNGHGSRDAIDSTLSAYNDHCAEMRSAARDAAIQVRIDNIGARRLVHPSLRS